MIQSQMKVTVFTTKNCGKCIILKQHLKKIGVSFEERDLGNTDVMTELVMDNVSLFYAPILRVDGQYHHISKVEELDGILNNR